MAQTNEFRPARLLAVVQELDRIIGLNKGISMIQVNQLFMGTKAYTNLNKFEKKNVYSMVEVKEVLKRVMERSMNSNAIDYTYINMSTKEGETEMELIKTTENNQVPENISEYFNANITGDSVEGLTAEQMEQLKKSESETATDGEVPTEYENTGDPNMELTGTGSITGGSDIEQINISNKENTEPGDRVFMFKDRTVHNVNEPIVVNAEAASSRKISANDIKDTEQPKDDTKKTSEENNKGNSSELSQNYIDEVEALVTAHKDEFNRFINLVKKYGKDFEPEHITNDLGVLGAISALSLIGRKYNYKDEQALSVMARLFNEKSGANPAEPVTKPDTDDTNKEIVPTDKIRTFEVIRPSEEEKKPIHTQKRSSLMQAYDRVRYA